ncbi:ATP-binding protein, partial [Plebeiibacterium sediminum]
MTKTVLRNLISNAIKFTPPEKYIKLSVHKFNDSYLEISIQDQGPGIPVHMLADLFKYSFNKPKIMNHKEAGTGLGLPICKEFIELQ